MLDTRMQLRSRWSARRPLGGQMRRVGLLVATLAALAGCGGPPADGLGQGAADSATAGSAAPGTEPSTAEHSPTG
jgi:hypothetical protein